LRTYGTPSDWKILLFYQHFVPMGHFTDAYHQYNLQS